MARSFRPQRRGDLRPAQADFGPVGRYGYPLDNFPDEAFQLNGAAGRAIALTARMRYAGPHQACEHQDRAGRSLRASALVAAVRGLRRGVALTAPLDTVGMDEGRVGNPAPLPHEPRAWLQRDRRRGFSRAAAQRVGDGLFQLPCGGPMERPPYARS